MEWRRFAGWLLVLMATGAFLLWLALQRLELVTYPSTISTGMGLLLAALTFFLGFARENSRRSNEAVGAEFRAEHDALLTQPPLTREGGRVSLPRLRDGAHRLQQASEDLEKFHQNLNSSETQALARRLHLWSVTRQERTELLYQSALNALGARQDPPDAKIQSRRVKNTERIGKALKSADEMWKSTQGLVGFGRSALMAQLALSVAHRVVAALLVLYIAGLCLTGFSHRLVVQPEFWTSTLFLALAAAYTSHTKRSIQIDQDSVQVSVEELPLLHLWLLERMVISPGDTDSPQVASERIRTEYAPRVMRLERVAPHLPWLWSIRGRLHLARALHEEVQWPLARAAADLQAAAAQLDDPLTLVALARALEELGDHDDEVADLTKQALDLLGDSVPTELSRDDEAWNWALTSAGLMEESRWCWPGDLRASFSKNDLQACFDHPHRYD